MSRVHLKSLDDLLEWCAQLPDGITLTPTTLLRIFRPGYGEEMEKADPPAVVHSVEWTWKERLWLAPAETLLGVPELKEALGRSKSWIYQRTGGTSIDGRIPHRKLDGVLVFTAGEIRAWVKDQSLVMVAGRMHFGPRRSASYPCRGQ